MIRREWRSGMMRFAARGVAVVGALLIGAATVQAQGDGSGGGVNLGVQMLTRDQAAAFLPPPVPVVDLSKPGNVYKSSDPLIAAAVADYLSKIKEPHDQFGNIIGPNYKSATTPDRVDSKLIAHIVAFVGGQRFIALSPRAAMSLRATQDIQRQKDIDKIIYDDWAAKTKAKVANINRARANGNTNAPGDVGNPNANSPTGGGGGGGGAGGGNANTGGPGGGGNENVPNLNGPPGGNTNGGGPQQGGVAAAIAQEFNVKITSSPKPWTDQELADLRDVLTKLPRRFYQGLTLSRDAVLSVNGKPEPRLPGRLQYTGRDAGTLTMADYARADNNGTREQDFPTPPWTVDEAKALHFRRVLARNIVDNFVTYSEKKPYHENTLVLDFSIAFGWSYNNQTQKWQFNPARRAERVSNYSLGTTAEPADPVVDIGESVAFYLYDPKRLRATQAGQSSRFNWVREKLGVATQPEDPNKTVGTPAQRNLTE